MAAATFNLTAVASRASAHLAIAGAKNCSRFASAAAKPLPSPAALQSGTKTDRKKATAAAKKGLVGDKLKSSKSSSRMKVKVAKGAARAEIYIEDQELGAAGTLSIAKTQSACVYGEYGSNEVLCTAEVTVPEVGPDQVLVKVHAAALNPVDFKRRLGKFKASDSELPTVPGYDVAGVVALVGSEVTKFKVGDRVYGDVSEHCLNAPKQYGTLAQFCAVEEKLIASIPQRLSFEEAASLPLAIETAYQSFEIMKLKEGETVLVLGGAGGVGSLAVQLAKKVFKASTVAATTSSAKVDFVKSLGADVVIDYTKEDLKEHKTKYDVVLDTVGKGEAPLVAKKTGGRAVALTGPADPPAVRYVVVSNGRLLEKLNPYLEEGTLKPIIDSKGTFKFSEVRDAFGYLETGRATGKVVVTII